MKVVSDGRVLRLFKIIDRQALELAINAFVSTHSWRSEFRLANPQQWWDSEEVSAYIKKPLVAVEEIEFEGLYKLLTLSIQGVNNELKIEVLVVGNKTR